MAKIPLPKGRFAIIDDEFVELVRHYSWYFDRHSGYVFTYDRGFKLYLHRLIMGEPLGRVDHWSGDKLDNRKHNLRSASHSENMRNRPVRSDSRSGYTGVAIKSGKKGDTFEAYIYQGERRIGLATYRNKVLAAFARDFAARRLHGEFAKYNFSALPAPKDIQRAVSRKLGKYGY